MSRRLVKCGDCSAVKPLIGRGLCERCYSRHRRRGTLEQFERLSEPSNIPYVEGISYRQLDYWIRQGYLRVPATGMGVARNWPPEEERVLRAMARLVAAGVTPATAAKVARGKSEIGPGVRIVLDELVGAS